MGRAYSGSDIWWLDQVHQAIYQHIGTDQYVEPLKDFVDEKCLVFGDAEENPHDYREVTVNVVGLAGRSQSCLVHKLIDQLNYIRLCRFTWSIFHSLKIS